MTCPVPWQDILTVVVVSVAWIVAGWVAIKTHRRN